MTIRQHRILKAIKQKLLEENKNNSSKSLYDQRIYSFQSGADGLHRRDTEEIATVESFALEALGFLKVVDLGGDAQFPVFIQITKQGVVAESDFWRDTLILWIKNIIVPAGVSIVVSLIVNTLIS